MTYAAPLDDMRFVLNHLAGLPEIATLPGFEDADPDEAILIEAGRLAGEVLTPLNSTGDREAAMDPKTMMQVPNAVRELAEKSRRASRKSLRAFMSAASKSVAMVPSPATEMSKNTMTLAEKNMKAAFDHARKLIHAKDVQEVTQLQADFVRTQFAAAGEQMKASTRGVSAAKDASKSTPNK